MKKNTRHIARRMLLKSTLGVGLLGAGTSLFAQTRSKTPGVSDTEIVIGNTAPYSGPASAYGVIGKIFEAHFRMVNDQGGINGRRIRYISLDDAYSPPKTVEQVRRLVEREQVAFMAGMAGGSTVVAAQKYLEDRKIPNLFIASGATRFGDHQSSPWTMGFGISYKAEGLVLAQYLLRDMSGSKVAVLYQNDEFGKDLYAGLRAGLGDKAKDMIVAERSYELTDPTVDSQIIGLQSSGADTLMNFSTPKFAAMSIRKVSQLGWKPTHFMSYVSASVGSVLTPAGLDKSVGLISTAYTKDPTDPQWANDPALTEWRAFMKKYLPEASLQDWVNVGVRSSAECLVQVLKQCGDDLSRGNIMRRASDIQNMELGGMLPGIKINTSSTDYYPVEQVRLQRFDGKQWVLFGELLGKV